MLFFILVSILLSLLVSLYIRMLYRYARKVKIFQNANGNSIKIIKEYKQAPGPFPWPIIGNLLLLTRYRVPFEGFTELSKELGDIYSLTLGSKRCLVVNNLELIREILNQKGKFFGGRPDFLRYDKLFGGDRSNSLALCDWSFLQQKRRNIARRYCSPRISSSYFSKMSNVGSFEVNELLERMKKKIPIDEEFNIKPLIQQTCANMFSQYMCSIRFQYDDVEFQMMVKYFDEIFWEINQGYALDFLPWLSPFYQKHTKTIVHWSNEIRKFILERIINQREQNFNLDEPVGDFTDALLRSLINDKNVSRDTIIFMLEDFIGGHSAVGNLVMISLAYIARNPAIGKQIQFEIDKTTKNGEKQITFFDMENMPHIMATIFEVLRHASSPIVPHVATEDAVIAGYGVTKGTIVFFNNYKLNTSSKYWENPELFDPYRFLEPANEKESSNAKTLGKNFRNTPDIIIKKKRRSSEGSDSGIEYERDLWALSSSISENSVLNQLLKHQNIPKTKHWLHEKVKLKKNIPHFLPFSIGKRTCIGQNLVKGFGFMLLANILQKYDISSKNLSSIKTVPACVALPTETFSLVLNPRSTT